MKRQIQICDVLSFKGLCFAETSLVLFDGL